MTDGQRLSVRRGLRPPSEPVEGVPDHLKFHLQYWLQGVFGYRSSDGMRQDVIMKVALMAGVPLHPDIQPVNLQNQVLEACYRESDVFLDVLDAALKVYGRDVASLKQVLETGGSAWTVAENGQSLQRRVDPMTAEAFKAATSPADKASEEVRIAWEQAYGRDPDPSDAWDHAIKAVEEVMIPVVVPNKAKATLGDVLGQLKANPGGWSLVLNTSGPTDSVETLEAMSRLMWPNPDRHDGGQTSRTPSLPEAEAVVQLAVLVVQWARAGAIRKS